MRVWLVAVQTAFTVTPGSTPPVLSVTVPEMSPVVRCAIRVVAVAMKATNPRTSTVPGRLCRMLALPFSVYLARRKGRASVAVVNRR